MKVSVVAPMYNEEAVAIEYLSAFHEFVTAYPHLKFELIIVDDGSTDSTGVLASAFESDHFVCQVLTHASNLGLEQAIVTGLAAAGGDLICTMDADLQDPFYPLIDAINIFKQDSSIDIVHLERRTRLGDTFFKRVTAGWVYLLISVASLGRIPNKDLANYKVLTSAARDRLLVNRTSVFRVDTWFQGFSVEVISYARAERQFGDTKFSTVKMLRFGMETLMAVCVRVTNGNG
jgi:glycosyltransferase involved in cell wall biosynthesis